MQENNEIIFDKAQFDNLKDLLAQGFKEFIIIYLNDFEQREKELSIAIKDKKIDNIKKIAHMLKGSSLSVGATGLAKICDELEVASKKGDFKEVEIMFDGLKELFPKFKEKYLQLSQ